MRTRHTIEAAVDSALSELRKAHRIYDAIPVDEPNWRRRDRAAIELATAAARYFRALDNLTERRDILRELRHTKQGELTAVLQATTPTRTTPNAPAKSP